MPQGDGLARIGALRAGARGVMAGLRTAMYEPDGIKRVERRYGITRAAALTGVSPQAIDKAERAGRLEPPERDGRGRRLGYTLPQINAMRGVFGTRVWRATDEPPMILAIQNFKGGVGKSALTAHFAQYLALRGYRTLVVDADSQGSTTTLFGFNPDEDIRLEDTLAPYLMGDVGRLDGMLAQTAWDGLDFIPANLGLYGAEYAAARALRNDPRFLLRLREGLEGVADAYDVILLDPPPALGLLSLSVAYAAEALVIPTPPGMVDFASTANFLEMLEEAMETLAEHGLRRDWRFVKLAITKLDERAGRQREARAMMAAAFGEAMLKTPMLASAEIDNASAQLRTVYELEDGGASQTHRRCRANLDTLFHEIETLISAEWGREL